MLRTTTQARLRRRTAYGFALPRRLASAVERRTASHYHAGSPPPSNGVRLRTTTQARLRRRTAYGFALPRRLASAVERRTASHYHAGSPPPSNGVRLRTTTQARLRRRTAYGFALPRRLASAVERRTASHYHAGLVSRLTSVRGGRERDRPGRLQTVELGGRHAQLTEDLRGVLPEQRRRPTDRSGRGRSAHRERQHPGGSVSRLL